MGSKKKRLRRVPELKRRLNQINIELREWKLGEKSGGGRKGAGGVEVEEEEESGVADG